MKDFVKLIVVKVSVEGLPQCLTYVLIVIVMYDILFKTIWYVVSCKFYCLFLDGNHIREGEAETMVASGTEAVVMPTGVAGL